MEDGRMEEGKGRMKDGRNRKMWLEEGNNGGWENGEGRKEGRRGKEEGEITCIRVGNGGGGGGRKEGRARSCGAGRD